MSTKFIALEDEHMEMAGRIYRELSHVPDPMQRQMVLVCFLLYFCHQGKHVPEQLFKHVEMNFKTIIDDFDLLERIITTVHRGVNGSRIVVPGGTHVN